MLDRDATMRSCVPHRRDDAELRIAPFEAADLRGMAQRRRGAVGRGDEPRLKLAAVRERGVATRGDASTRSTASGAGNSRLGKSRTCSIGTRPSTRFSTM